ncbi:histone deacetylase [Notoacmeibacter sp. MSK16QG-6]|uniref:histone deacetylase family protein n=1 Tax=Notoacmeibacter sp. MSK16QG-6 TaxID=2957982 RepID=UPI0020A039BC|nr:histone deacetylase [Notoacmeibacter sp. MSK16QG-6]MCP1198602.1 histone deacetylase [Notoacmeibacter sp. MSK16QG-6]
MARLPIVHHPDYDARFSPVHRFPMGKYTLLMNALRERGIVDRASLHRPGLAPSNWLGLAHDRGYVDRVLTQRVPPVIERLIGFAVDERVARRASLACAGTVLAARLALEEGLACNTAGGSHHARFEHGAGFCVFNDVAVATEVLRAGGEARRVLIIDADVHQGDGTARIFADQPDVFTFSIHGAKNYPNAKETSDLDIELADGTGDEAYLERLAAGLNEALTRFPDTDFAFYLAGVDPHREDRLGRLSMTDEGLARRDEMVLSALRERSIPTACVISGGYSRDMESLGRRHAIVFCVAEALMQKLG